MANISLFLQGACELGLQPSELFQTVDLYEAKDMGAVINTILTLARHSNKKPSPCPSPLSIASLDDSRYDKASLDQESVDQRPPTMDSGYSTLAQRRQHGDYQKRSLFHSQQCQSSHQEHQGTDIQHVEHIMQGDRIKNNGSIYPCSLYQLLVLNAHVQELISTSIDNTEAMKYSNSVKALIPWQMTTRTTKSRSRSQ